VSEHRSGDFANRRNWYSAFCDTFGIKPEPTMMSLDSTAELDYLRRIRPLCMVTIMAFAIQLLLPHGVAAQAVGDSPVLTPGLHSLSLPRADEPPVRYAISIPRNYSPSTPVPLVLALHFGVGGGDAAGAGGDVVRILIGPALAELGAVIVAPDSVRGDWSSPENEKAVNALLDTILARYSIDKILRRNSLNVSALPFRSPAGRRHPPQVGAFRFWRFTPATTRSYLLVQRRRELRNFRKQG
jgi:hypothetical protein